MAIINKAKGQTIIYKTRHRILKIEQYEPEKLWMNSSAPKVQAVPALLLAPYVHITVKWHEDHLTDRSCWSPIYVNLCKQQMKHEPIPSKQTRVKTTEPCFYAEAVTNMTLAKWTKRIPIKTVRSVVTIFIERTRWQTIKHAGKNMGWVGHMNHRLAEVNEDIVVSFW